MCGLSPATHRAYLRHVAQLAQFYGKSPDLVTDEEFRRYFALSDSSLAGAAAGFQKLWMALGGTSTNSPSRTVADMPLLTALVRTHHATDQRTATHAGQLWDALSVDVDEHALQEAEGQARTTAPERLVSLLSAYVSDVS